MTVRLGTLARLRGRGVVRDAGEPHRTATTLELFFDLTFVVAVAQAAAALDHELAADHVAIGVVGFLGVFAAIWWAWMNYTWFASAHDSGDVPYRLLTLVQMAGALVLGESVLSASVGFQAALDEGGLTAALLVVGIGGLLLAFTAWWIYFGHPGT